MASHNQSPKLPFIEHRSAAASKLADLTTISLDMNFVVGCCQQLLAMPETTETESVLTRSLYTSALVAYARCFSSGVRKSLKPSIFAGLKGDPIGTHNLYVDLRNKHIAHSVNSFEECAVGAFLTSMNADDAAVAGVGTFYKSFIVHSNEGIKQLGQLAKFAHTNVLNQIEKQTAIVLEELQRIPIEELTVRSSAKLTGDDPERAGRSRNRREK